VISGDTGVSHLASAWGTPSVTLFGPTPARLWGPPQDERHVVLEHAAGRRGDPHADDPDPALLEIGVDEVIAAATGRLAASGRGGQ
jgi:ADP-heptose:LPS heptosyltransferase